MVIRFRVACALLVLPCVLALLTVSMQAHPTLCLIAIAVLALVVLNDKR
jgi:hypothetical protein